MKINFVMTTMSLSVYLSPLGRFGTSLTEGYFGPDGKSVLMLRKIG